MIKFRDNTPVELPKTRQKSLTIRTKEPIRYGIDRLDIVSKESAKILRKKTKAIRSELTQYGKLTIHDIEKIGKKDKLYKKFRFIRIYVESLGLRSPQCW